MKDDARKTWMRRSAPQIARRLLQFGVLVFIVYAALGGPWRNYKVAHNSARLVTLMHGETWGDLYALNEAALGTMGEPYETSTEFLGMPWASRIAGIDGADPTMVLGNLVATGSVTWALLLGLILPLGVALLLGKVFCSHLCPMRLLFEIGQMVRRGLGRLGVHFPALRHDARFGGWVLAGGLLATAIASTVVWFFILPYLALSSAVFLYISTGVVTAIVAVAGAWLFLDMFAAPGYFCHNVCPTGFLLEQVGRFSLLRLRKRDRDACPDSCFQCQRVCPYHLLPKEESHRPACDNCGRCVAACPGRKLVRKISLPVIGALAFFVVPGVAEAHHNKGLPHYGYFENYPQVPTDEYITIQGKWEMGATFFNFQGLDRRTADTPNDVKIYAYLYDLDADHAYRQKADFEIRQGERVISRFERLAVDEEAVYSTRETLPESGEYDLVAIVGDTEVVLPFHIELAGDGVSWLFIAVITAPIALIFVLAYVGRVRQMRDTKTRDIKTRDTKTRDKRPGRRRGAAARNATAALALIAVALAGQDSHAGDRSPSGDELTPSAVAVVSPEDDKNSPAHDHAQGNDHDHDHDHAQGSSGSHASSGQGEVCSVCGMVNCTMEHITTESGEVMVMGGIPLWLFLSGVAGILLLSFVGTEWLAPRSPTRSPGGFRLDLIRNRRVYALVRNRWFQAGPQLVMAAILLFLIYIGLFGSRVANLTPIAVWTLWWGGLIFAVLLLGSAWCFVCPWDGLANLFSRLRLAARVEPLSLGISFPPWLANVYLAIGLFVLLTWLELGFGVTTNPRSTAYMGLGMAALAIGFALLFDGKRFCAHACPVGRICGVYSRFSPIEIRARKARTCQACRTEDCLHGNDRGYPCPTGLSLKTITSSTLCTMCTECVKSCDKQNIALNLRPFGSGLREIRTPRRDEAWLALVLLVLTLFHGLTMTPAWEDLRPGQDSLLKWMSVTFGTSSTVNFTVAMAFICAAPIGLYWLCCRLGAYLGGEGVTPGRLFVSYAYSLLPVALFYHLAHNLMHLLMEGGEIVPLVSDPMGDGSNYLGTASAHVGHLVAESTMWYAQVSLILIGHIFGIIVAHRIGRGLYKTRRAASLGSLPMLALMIAISIGGLYLMHLDMNMRIGRM